MITLPEKIKTTKPFSIKVVLAKYDYEGRSIGMLTNYTDYDISIDGQVFYKSESPQITMPKSNGGQIYTIINLPKKIKNPIMTINYYPKLNFEARYSIESIDLGNRDDFFINMLEKDFPILSLVFLMFMLFLVSMVISVSSYSSGVFENSIFYVGMSLLLTGMYFLTKTKTVIYLLSEKRAIIYFLDYGPFMFIIYPVLKLIENKVKPIFTKIIAVAVKVLEITYIVEFILTVIRLLDFKYLFLFNLILNFIYGLLIAVSLIFSINGKNKDSILLAISVIPLFVNHCRHTHQSQRACRGPGPRRGRVRRSWPAPPSSSSWPAPRSGGSARPTRHTRWPGPAACANRLCPCHAASATARCCGCARRAWPVRWTGLRSAASRAADPR